MHIVTADNHPLEEWRPGVETRMLVSAIPAHRKHGFRNADTGILHVHAVLSSSIFEMSVCQRMEIFKDMSMIKNRPWAARSK